DEVAVVRGAGLHPVVAGHGGAVDLRPAVVAKDDGLHLIGRRYGRSARPPVGHPGLAVPRGRLVPDQVVKGPRRDPDIAKIGLRVAVVDNLRIGRGEGRRTRRVGAELNGDGVAVRRVVGSAYRYAGRGYRIALGDKAL